MNRRYVINSKAMSRFACLIVAVIACSDLIKIRLGNGFLSYWMYIFLFIASAFAFLLKPKMQKSPTIFLWSLFYLAIFISSLNQGAFFSGANIRIFAIITFLLAFSEYDFEQVKIAIYIIIAYSIFQAAGIYLQLILPGVHNAIFNIITILFDLHEGGIAYETMSDLGYFRGFSVNPGFAAIYIVNGIICLSIFKEKIPKFRYYTLNSVLFLSLALTGKRGQLLAFTISFIVVYIFCSDSFVAHIKHVFAAVAVIGLLYLAGLYLYVHHPDMPGLSRTLNLLYGSSRDFYALTSGRTNLWDTALSLYKGNETFGIGWNQYLHIRGMLPHNTYLQVLCELGIVGLVLFLVSLTITLVLTFQAYFNNMNGDCSGIKKTLLRTFILFQIYFVIYSVSGNTLWDVSIYYMYFMLLAISIKYIGKNELNTRVDKIAKLS